MFYRPNLLYKVVMRCLVSSSTHKETSQAEAAKEDQDHDEEMEKEVAEDEHD